jgi:7-cyano-7-deazaguanine synthase in queuosine biosynthesis
VDKSVLQEKKVTRRALVCWSGGCDSTLALERLLKDENVTVRTISFTYNRQLAAVKEQRKARKKLKKKLEKMYHKFDSFEVAVNTSDPGSLESGDCVIQPAMWIPLTYLHARADEEIHFGYVKEDCFWHVKREMGYVLRYLMDVVGKEIILRYPLEWTEKCYVIEELKDLGLLDDCWYCENPKLVHGTKKNRTVQCGHCECCVNHRTALAKSKIKLERFGTPS